MQALIQRGGSARWEAREQWRPQQHREWIDPAVHNRGGEGEPIGLERGGPALDCDDVAALERKLGGDRPCRRIDDGFPGDGAGSQTRRSVCDFADRGEVFEPAPADVAAELRSS